MELLTASTMLKGLVSPFYLNEGYCWQISSTPLDDSIVVEALWTSRLIFCLAQVNVTLQSAATLAITISAYSLFIAQPYSLAVLGSFNGTLASTYNPAYRGEAPLTCNQPITKLTSGLARYTVNASPTFTFTSDTGASDGLKS